MTIGSQTIFKQLSYYFLLGLVASSNLNADIIFEPNTGNPFDPSVPIFDGSDPWNNSGINIVGGFGVLGISEPGYLEVNDGSIVNSSNDSAIGLNNIGGLFLRNGAGDVLIRDLGSQWNITGDLTVAGGDAEASLTILNGGFVGSTEGTLNQTGTVTISGAGSTWNIENGLRTRGGDITIENGGLLRSSFLTFSSFRNNETININGANSRFELLNDGLDINSGTINISNGGSSESESVFIRGASSSINISGTDSSLVTTDDRFGGSGSIGVAEQGQLTVSDNASVNTNTLVLSSNGQVDLTDSNLNVRDTLVVTDKGQLSITNSTVTVEDTLVFEEENDGIITGSEPFVEFDFSQQGAIQLDNGIIDTKNLLVEDIFSLIGNENGVTGTGTIVTDGLLSNLDLDFSGFQSGGNILFSDIDLVDTTGRTSFSISTTENSLTIQTSFGSFFNENNTGELGIGIGLGNRFSTDDTGTGSLIVADGIQIYSGNAFIGTDNGIAASGAQNIATITGTDSAWTVNGDLIVGHNGRSDNRLNIEDGGRVNAQNVVVGNSQLSAGAIHVTGADSSLSVDENINIKNGQLSVFDDGLVEANTIFVGSSESTAEIFGDGQIISNSLSLTNATISAAASEDLNSGSIGTLNITADVSLESSSQILVDIASDNQIDLIEIVGSISLDETTEIVFNLGDTIPVEDFDYVFLTSTESLQDAALFNSLSLSFTHRDGLDFDSILQIVNLGDRFGLAIEFSDVSEVPVPAAIWLFATACLFLTKRRYRNV